MSGEQQHQPDWEAPSWTRQAEVQHQFQAAPHGYLTRAQAGLALPRQFAGWMRLPARDVWIHHTVTGTYLPNPGPAAGARAIQQIAFSRGFNDISYSFLVFHNGMIVEGRGWGVVGGHTRNHNSTSHAICYVGNYQDTHHPTRQQEESARWLISEGQRLGYIATGTKPTGGHRDVGATACPGVRVYTTIPRLRIPWVQAPAPTPTPAGQESSTVVLEHSGEGSPTHKGWRLIYHPDGQTVFAAPPASGLSPPSAKIKHSVWESLVKPLDEAKRLRRIN
jgi:hypothetical protein